MSVNAKEFKPVPLAIVGIGCLFPKAQGREAFWANIKGGVDAVTDIPASHWKAEDYFDGDPGTPDMTYAKRGAFLEAVDFNPLEFGITPNNIEATDTTQLLGMVAAQQALRDAGYATGKDVQDGRAFDRDRTSVILGVTGALELVIPLGARLGHPIWRRALKDAGVEKSVAEDVVARIADSYVPWQENSFPGLLGNVAAGRIANRFDLGGTNCVVDAACASSLGAVHMAAMELYAGRSDMAITGGIDTFNDIFMYMCFSKTPALSPTGASRPFAAGADGTILGEGLGIVILKRLDDARRDGDRIHAVIRSIGSSSDGKGNAVYAPSASGQVKCLMSAYGQAGVSAKTVELVEGHGTGTKVGDGVEAKALAEVMGLAGSERVSCALGSVKSMIGHTKAAAGIAGLIKAALALENKVLPPSIKVEQPLDAVGNGPLYVNTVKRPWVSRADHPRRAGVSAFGFGGSNFHCVMEEGAKVKAEADWDDSVVILAWSAESRQELAAALGRFDVKMAWEEMRVAGAKLRKTFRAEAGCRVVIVARKGETDVAKAVEAAKGRIGHTEDSQSTGLRTAQTRGTLLPGIYFGEGKPEKLGVLFPGQGSQYPGMLRDLACQFPAMLEALETADGAFGEQTHGARLSDRIYPVPVFTDEARAADERALNETRVAQPAIGAASVGAWKVLKEFGVKPDAAAGHSFGELTALWAAGRIDEKSLHVLANVRGKAMAAAAAGSAGAMVAVQAAIADVEKMIAAEKLRLVIANKNAPRQVVLSGDAAEIERAMKACDTRGLRNVRLAVSAAFHSPMVAAAQAVLGSALQTVTIWSGSVPVFANSTGGEYPSDSRAAAELLAGQLARPVEFVRQIEDMFKAGVRVFLEVGPGARLSGLVRSILEGRGHEAIALDAGGGKRSGVYDLGCVLGQLAALGYAVDLAKWDLPAARQAELPAIKKAGMTVKLTGANVVKPREKRAAVAPAQKVPAARVMPAVIEAVAPVRPAEATVKGDNQHALRASVERAPERQEKGKIRVSQNQDVNVNAGLSQAVALTQQSMVALQKMQEQTAQLHQQYLLGQEAAQRTMQQLVEQQMRLLAAAGGVAMPMAMPAVVAQVQTPAVRVAAAAQKIYTPVQPIVEPVVAKARAAVRESAPAAVSETRRSAASTILLEVVADKTGYPVEMLNLDMTLDADLGIDSIKRVEILSALQTRMPEAPVVKPEDLGRLQTLREIVAFLDAGASSSAADLLSGISHPHSAHAAPAAPLSMAHGAQMVLLEVVADKTGYPVEMLELDMTLDADLGIDSIKRVEILSALQTRMPEAPVVKPEDLGRLQTLREIVAFLDAGASSSAGDMLSGISHPHSANAAPAAPLSMAHGAQKILLEVVADKTGYPVEMLELDMTLDADLGIDSIKRVEILSALQTRMPEAPVVKPEDLGRLQTLREIVAFLDGGSTAASASVAEVVQASPALQPKGWTPSVLDRQVLRVVPLDGRARVELKLPRKSAVWVTDDGKGLAEIVAAGLNARGAMAKVIELDAVPPQAGAGLVILSPAEPAEGFIQAAFKLIQAMGPSLRAAGREGDAFLVSVSRMDGSFALNGHTPRHPLTGGLAGLVKTAAHEWPEVSCKSLDVDDGHDAAQVAGHIVEEVLLRGPGEVGISAAGRVETRLVKEEMGTASGARTIAAEDVIVVTGGARGVTAAVSLALAREFGCGLLLLGRSPLPQTEPAWLAGVSGEASIKKVLAANGAKSPKALEEAYRGVVASREIVATLKDIEKVGGRVMYRAVNVRDAASVKQAMDEARRTMGPISGIVHGAGVLQDRLIERKTAEQFDDVFSTKVDGFNALLAGAAEDDVKVIVAFSSSTGRFGRKGQVAYAAANEVLNKMAQREAHLRPRCRVISVNWGPWEGGMVTPALRRVFEEEGVGLIPLLAGAEYLVREISTPAGGPVEIVILGPSPASAASVGAEMALAFERGVDAESHRFLQSHVLKGHAVLPVAMMVEWMGHGAMHENPGLKFHGFDDLRVFKGVILDPGEKITLHVLTGAAVQADGVERVPVEMRCGSVLHARATMVLSADWPAAPGAMSLPKGGRYSVANDDLYSCGRLFHGADLHGIVAVEGWSKDGIAGKVSAAPAPLEWMKRPLRSGWLADPLVLDSAFQLMILWCFEARGAGSLPTRVAKYRQFAAFPTGGVRVLAKVTGAGEHAAQATIDFVDGGGKLVARMEGYECVMDASLAESFAKNQLAGA